MERKFRQNSVFSTLGKTKQFKRTLENESIELRRMTRNTNEESTVITEEQRCGDCVIWRRRSQGVEKPKRISCIE